MVLTLQNAKLTKLLPEWRRQSREANILSYEMAYLWCHKREYLFPFSRDLRTKWMLAIIWLTFRIASDELLTLSGD
jgi:hypothetical protein